MGDATQEDAAPAGRDHMPASNSAIIATSSFVDEYQDLGHALHELVLLLRLGGGIRLFAVGDADYSTVLPEQTRSSSKA